MTVHRMPGDIWDVVLPFLSNRRALACVGRAFWRRITDGGWHTLHLVNPGRLPPLAVHTRDLHISGVSPSRGQLFSGKPSPPVPVRSHTPERAWKRLEPSSRSCRRPPCRASFPCRCRCSAPNRPRRWPTSCSIRIIGRPPSAPCVSTWRASSRFLSVAFDRSGWGVFFFVCVRVSNWFHRDWNPRSGGRRGHALPPGHGVRW